MDRLEPPQAFSFDGNVSHSVSQVFQILRIPEANVQLMGKFMPAIKRTISTFASNVLVKKYMKLEGINLMIINDY